MPGAVFMLQRFPCRNPSRGLASRSPGLPGKETAMTTELGRRQFLEATGFAVAGLAAAAGVGTGAAIAQTTQSGGKAPMTYDIKPRPFHPTPINGLSEKLLTSHYDNNYSGAVKRLNAISTQLGGLDWANAPVFTINGLKREE